MILLKYINFYLSVIFMLLCFYQVLYIPISWFLKRKQKPLSDKKNRFAVLICARNESVVIPDLIASVKAQTYSSQFIDTFVLADNCTDDTADVSRKAGAIAYERFNKVEVGKSYALNALLKKIQEDYPDKYDAFLIMDADNILSKNYIEKMNDSINCGNQIITSYRASKNFGDNWISASSSIWFLRESRYMNNPRHLIHSSCLVNGTGFLFTKEILEEIGDWHYHTLTEDLEFSYDMVIRGKKIAYCDAVFYDEQPTLLSQSWTQRKRWIRGGLQAFLKYGVSLFKAIVKGNFAAYDIIMANIMCFVFSVVSGICNMTFYIWGSIRHENPFIMVEPIVVLLLGMYALFFSMGAVVMISEWKKIYIPNSKKILYMFMFPIHMFLYIPLSFVAILGKVEWKQITHSVRVSDENDISKQQ